jgi:AcrR family transcriptional regulator
MTRPARRTQAERSGEMRARLAHAAYEVIAERGHSAFRTAALASHAGVSQGALLHHFPTKEAITLAAIQYALEKDDARSHIRILNAGSDIRAVLHSMAQDFIDFFMGDRFWVSLDITMDAAKDASVSPAIRQLVGQARRPVYDSWINALTAQGWHNDRAADGVRSTAALISGFAIRSLWTEDGDTLHGTLERWFDFLLQN